MFLFYVFSQNLRAKPSSRLRTALAACVAATSVEDGPTCSWPASSSGAPGLVAFLVRKSRNWIFFFGGGGGNTLYDVTL